MLEGLLKMTIHFGAQYNLYPKDTKSSPPPQGHIQFDIERASKLAHSFTKVENYGQTSDVLLITSPKHAQQAEVYNNTNAEHERFEIISTEGVSPCHDGAIILTDDEHSSDVTDFRDTFEHFKNAGLGAEYIKALPDNNPKAKHIYSVACPTQQYR